jgi:predicted phosphodiesterase
MKIAVLSDIHGNLTAFNAVLKDINDLELVSI